MWCDVSCGYARPISGHFLGGCPLALSQGHFTYRHDVVLHCKHVVSSLFHIFAESQAIHVYADLPGMYASVSPQATIPPTLIVTPYRLDTVIYNEFINSFVLLKLTCPLDSIHHLVSARDRKQTKEDCLQIVYICTGSIWAGKIKNSQLLQYNGNKCSQSSFPVLTVQWS